MKTIDFKKHLNSEQYSAVTAPDGSILVLAAAGTGKTRTLVYRVAYLVEKGIHPSRILLLTFTNRASREMLERAKELVGPDVGGVWGGTFHHMANKILRKHARLVGFKPDYGILDSDDQRTLMSNCVKSLKLQSKDFPKREVLLSMASESANSEIPISEVVEGRFADFLVDPADIIRVIELYRKEKLDLGAMDFDDMLINCLKLFREHPDVLGQYQEQFQHVLVDEYQDTNAIQAEMIDKLAAGHGNLMVVGDDFQCIYSWRGAVFENIISFPNRYKGVHTYKLETNYRSIPEVLDVANACIAGNPDQFQKVLKPTREHGSKPRIIHSRDGQEQARCIVDELRRLGREGYKLSDIAILYRAHYHAMELQIQLLRDNVDYEITSGVRFFEQAHIKDVCSVLRILESATDRLAFARLIQLMPGVGPKTASKIWVKLGGSFDAAIPEERKKILELLPEAAKHIWKEINVVLKEYKEEKLFNDAGEVIRRFLEMFYDHYALNTYENSDRRVDDVMELALYTDKYDSIGAFLEDVALLTNVDTRYERNYHVDKEELTLSTVHQAKGLEWPIVIILWATEGMFPSARSLTENDAGEAEERRLFYVAVTRAKDDLCICVPEVRRTRDGNVHYCSPSRFVTELPEELVKDVNAWNM